MNHDDIRAEILGALSTTAQAWIAMHELYTGMKEAGFSEDAARDIVARILISGRKEN